MAGKQISSTSRCGADSEKHSWLRHPETVAAEVTSRRAGLPPPGVTVSLQCDLSLSCDNAAIYRSFVVSHPQSDAADMEPWTSR